MVYAFHAATGIERSRPDRLSRSVRVAVAGFLPGVGLILITVGP